eukprot:15439253-Alexandrium_andersonii.AAC.1
MIPCLSARCISIVPMRSRGVTQPLTVAIPQWYYSVQTCGCVNMAMLVVEIRQTEVLPRCADEAGRFTTSFGRSNLPTRPRAGTPCRHRASIWPETPMTQPLQGPKVGPKLPSQDAGPRGAERQPPAGFSGSCPRPP